MVDEERPQDLDALPGGEATLGTAFNKMRVIRQACLDKCDVMSCGTYEFSESMRRSDWILMVVVAAVFLAITLLGYLV
jgi:hypothetical protein